MRCVANVKWAALYLVAVHRYGCTYVLLVETATFGKEIRKGFGRVIEASVVWNRSDDLSRSIWL